MHEKKSTVTLNGSLVLKKINKNLNDNGKNMLIVGYFDYQFRKFFFFSAQLFILSQ